MMIYLKKNNDFSDNKYMKGLQMVFKIGKKIEAKENA